MQITDAHTLGRNLLRVAALALASARYRTVGGKLLTIGVQLIGGGCKARRDRRELVRTLPQCRWRS